MNCKTHSQLQIRLSLSYSIWNKAKSATLWLSFTKINRILHLQQSFLELNYVEFFLQFSGCLLKFMVCSVCFLELQESFQCPGFTVRKKNWEGLMSL